MHGPGAVGDDLEKGRSTRTLTCCVLFFISHPPDIISPFFMCTLIGLEIMDTYEKELARVEASRQDLAKAEKLFSLPITMYPELLNVQKEMKGLRQIYEIYRSQKVRISIHHINFDLLLFWSHVLNSCDTGVCIFLRQLRQSGRRLFG